MKRFSELIIELEDNLKNNPTFFLKILNTFLSRVISAIRDNFYDIAYMVGC